MDSYFVLQVQSFLNGDSYDINYLWEFIREKEIRWIESYEHKKGLSIIDGDFLIYDLDDTYDYTDISIREDIYYC